MFKLISEEDPEALPTGSLVISGVSKDVQDPGAFDMRGFRYVSKGEYGGRKVAMRTLYSRQQKAGALSSDSPNDINSFIL